MTITYQDRTFVHLEYCVSVSVRTRLIDTLLPGRVFVFPPEAPLPERPPGDGGAATYVNIPISPTSKKQLNYMELELQEAGPGTRATASHPPPQSKEASELMLGLALLG